MQPTLTSRWSISLLFFSILFLILPKINAAPHRHDHHNKQKRVPSALDDDYEYRDFNDYTSGVAIDYAKVSKTKKMMPDGPTTTTTVEEQPFYQKTNRYPKMALRKFRDDAEQRRQWYEALFTRRRR